MAHNITKRDIQVGVEMAWHGLTRVETTIDRNNCGIVYPMELQPLYSKDGADTPYWAVFSLDDNLPIGGTVGNGYALISNERMWEMIENSLAGTKHEIVSVGSVGGREKVFCSIRLDQKIIKAGGRDTEPTLNILWGHGGKFSVLAKSGFTVVVCANTFAMAIGRKSKDFEMRVRHTGSAESKLEGMEKAIDSHYGVAAEFQIAMDSLSAQPCTPDRARKIAAGFMVRDLDKIEELPTRTENIIDRIAELHVGGKGNDGNDLCDLFNAFTDYYTHESSGGNNPWKQFESSEFGIAGKRKVEAYQLLTGANVRDLGDLATVEARGDKVLNLA